VSLSSVGHPPLCGVRVGFLKLGDIINSKSGVSWAHGGYTDRGQDLYH